jgi:hypothetical protein
MYVTLSDLVADIAQNAAESGASLVELELAEGKGAGDCPEFRFTVKDNGRGMSQEELKRAMNPFANSGEKHPKRRVGLGLPFLMQTVLQSGGGWEIKSKPNEGTIISAWFDMARVDTPPAGDLPGTFRTVLLFPGPEEVIIRHSWDDGRLRYGIRKTELAGALGGLEDAESLILLDRYLRSLKDDSEARRASFKTHCDFETASGCTYN